MVTTAATAATKSEKVTWFQHQGVWYRLGLDTLGGGVCLAIVSGDGEPWRMPRGYENIDDCDESETGKVCIRGKFADELRRIARECGSEAVLRKIREEGYDL